MLVCVSQPNLLNYSTETDEIWYVNVFLFVDLNPIEKISVRSLFSKKIDFFEFFILPPYPPQTVRPIYSVQFSG